MPAFSKNSLHGASNRSNLLQSHYAVPLIFGRHILSVLTLPKRTRKLLQGNCVCFRHKCEIVVSSNLHRPRKLQSFLSQPELRRPLFSLFYAEAPHKLHLNL